jgi:hypothetical protein
MVNFDEKEYWMKIMRFIAEEESRRTIKGDAEPLTRTQILTLLDPTWK